MKKIALLLALLMLLCCAGCGEKEETPAGQGTPGTTEQQPDVGSDEQMEDLCPESDSGEHEFAEELVVEATCTEPGLMMYTCNACSYSVTKELPAYGHAGTGASCDEPSICTVCGEVAEEPWGHEDESGVCKNCGIDMMEIPTRPQPTEPEETALEEVDTTEAATQQ